MSFIFITLRLGRRLAFSSNEPTMTYRIERRVIGDLVVLYICGRITEQGVDTLRNLLEQNGIAAIDLKDVLIVERETITLLAVCESNGVELRNCPAYIREWVTREKEPTK